MDRRQFGAQPLHKFGTIKSIFYRSSELLNYVISTNKMWQKIRLWYVAIFPIEKRLNAGIGMDIRDRGQYCLFNVPVISAYSVSVATMYGLSYTPVAPFTNMV